MKRLLAALFGVALLMAVASACYASELSGPKFSPTQVIWRTQTAGANQTYFDSTTTNRLGAVTCVLDTTAGINTAQWARPTVQVLAAGDTNNVWMAFNVYDSQGGSSTTADSIYVMLQTSYDGVAWVSNATLTGATAGATVSRLDQTQGTGTFFGRLNLLGASGGTPSWIVQYKVRGPTNTAIADQTWLHKYPFIRWIVGFPDAVKYSVRAQVFAPQYEVIQ